MSFSGRRVSILRPSSDRRFSTSKGLSDNGNYIPLLQP
jgi:hypothetical protein